MSGSTPSQPPPPETALARSDAELARDRNRSMRTVGLLALCQALFMTGGNIVMLNAALAGEMLLGTDKSLATLPLSLQFVGNMATSIPASLLMRRIGRRAGFTVGTMIGLAGAGLTVWAILAGWFWLMCLGGALIGSSMGFGHYYRFAAADTATAGFRAQAISLVVAGGVVAAMVGPVLARETVDLFAPVLFAGCYAVVAVLQLATAAVLHVIDIPAPTRADRAETGRPLAEIARQPAFIVAVGGAAIGYAVMALVMTATPLAMLACGFGYADTTWVIQFHALAMFAPSFFTGSLIARVGVLRVMAVGAVLNLACVAIHLAGIGFGNFTLGLVLLGLGWNFLFVGGSTLLTDTYRPAEKAKVQAMNDFLVFGSAAVASLSAGAVQAGYGWDRVNLVMVPPVIAVGAALLWLAVARRRDPRAGLAA